MIHKIVSVTFYQTVTFHENAIKGRKAFNTLDEVLLKGVKLSRLGESIVIEHDDFETSYCVGMANVRHYRFEKGQDPEQEALDALERNKNNPVDLDGNTVSISDFSGSIVVLNF